MECKELKTEKENKEYKKIKVFFNYGKEWKRSDNVLGQRIQNYSLKKLSRSHSNKKLIIVCKKLLCY